MASATHTMYLADSLLRDKSAHHLVGIESGEDFLYKAIAR